MSFNLNPFAPIVNLVSGVIDKIIPDKNAAAQAKAALEKMHESGDLALLSKQLDINLQEAKSTNWFVAGARPFLIWAGGACLVYSTIASTIHGLPPVNATILASWSTLLLTLVGARSYEKKNNVEGNR